jgi:hypothetical protein
MAHRGQPVLQAPQGLLVYKVILALQDQPGPKASQALRGRLVLRGRRAQLAPPARQDQPDRKV